MPSYKHTKHEGRYLCHEEKKFKWKQTWKYHNMNHYEYISLEIVYNGMNIKRVKKNLFVSSLFSLQAVSSFISTLFKNVWFSSRKGENVLQKFSMSLLISLDIPPMTFINFFLSGARFIAPINAVLANQP